MASKSSVSKSIGLKAVYRFQGEQVHAFECYPKAEESSNEYLTKNDDSEAANHDFSGKMDGGVTIPTLKSSGPFASLVTSIKVSIC
jgi:hypothetical protein